MLLTCSSITCTNTLKKSQPKFCSLSCSTKERNRIKTLEKINQYKHNPSKCKMCFTSLEFDKRNNKFCSHSCSASYNNPAHTSFGPKRSTNGVNSQKRYKKQYPYSKVELRVCEYTGKLWWYNGVHQRFSPYRKSLKEQFYKKCAFKFNVYNYPELFNLSLIDKLGWYSCPRKNDTSKIKNINGVSRDHKVSIKEAFENNYDPYYISHVMNCEILPHSENKSKEYKSSITYEELISLVKKYDTIST